MNKTAGSTRVLRYGFCADVTTQRFPELITSLIGYDLKTVQLYTMRPLCTSTERQWLHTVWPADFRFNVHAPHTVNLAGSRSGTVGQLNTMMANIGDLNGCVVVHCGQFDKNLPTPHHLATIWANLNDPHLLRTSKVLLENAAGEGTLTKSKSFEYGRTIDEIRVLYEGIDRSDNIGFCLDTQHSFAGGICEWQTSNQVTTFLDEVDAALPGKLQLIHLNGSYKKFGARVDRHAPLAFRELVSTTKEPKQDYIWYDRGCDGLRTLLTRAADAGWDVISETPDHHHDLAVIASLWS